AVIVMAEAGLPSFLAPGPSLRGAGGFTAGSVLAPGAITRTGLARIFDSTDCSSVASAAASPRSRLMTRAVPAGAPASPSARGPGGRRGLAPIRGASGAHLLEELGDAPQVPDGVADQEAFADRRRLAERAEQGLHARQGILRVEGLQGHQDLDDLGVAALPQL